MSEFDDKLNSILSDPQAMGKIMQLAQSLSGDTPSAPPVSPVPPAPAPSAAPSFDPFAFLAGNGSGPDPKLLATLMPLIQELGREQDSHARQLLYALRPYLKQDRQEKVERALQLARLLHLGRKFLAGREG